MSAITLQNLKFSIKNEVITRMQTSSYTQYEGVRPLVNTLLYTKVQMLFQFFKNVPWITKAV